MSPTSAEVLVWDFLVRQKQGSFCQPIKTPFIQRLLVFILHTCYLQNAILTTKNTSRVNIQLL